MKNLSVAAGLFLLFTLLTGVIYPIIITLFSQGVFPSQANSSLVRKEGRIVGSALIGQQFVSPGYFHTRSSACNFETMPSGASNLSPSSGKLREQMENRRSGFIAENQLAPGTVIPVEMLTSSGSGLDPHISREAALLQVDRISKARGLDHKGALSIRALVDSLTEKPQFHIFGEYRVNVLLLNLELDKHNISD